MLLVPLVMAAGVAEATPIPFEDVVDLSEDVGPGETIIYSHNIRWLLPAEYVMHETTLNLQLVDNPVPVGQPNDEFEMSLVIGEGLTTTFGSPGVGLLEVNVAALDDGLMYVTVTSVGDGDNPAGDFIALDSTLSGTFSTVPEPATMVLFVMGGIATAVTHRKFRKKK